MPRDRKGQSPEKSRHATTRQTRASKHTERDRSTEIPTHAMVTRSRSRDKDNKIVFTQLTDDPPKKQRKQPVEKKKTTKTATKTSERRKENIAVSNKAPQSSDEDDAPEEPPPKAKKSATLKASQRTPLPPVSHTLSPKRRDRPESLQSPGRRSPETLTAPRVPGPSNASSPPRRDDVIGGLERSTPFSVKLPKHSKVALEKRQTTKLSERKEGKSTVPVDQQSSGEDHELNASTLRVPPRSPVHHPPSPMPENRPEFHRSPRKRPTETPAATQGPGPSNTSGPPRRDDVIGGLERSPTYFVISPKHSKVALEKEKMTKPSERKGGKLTVPVDQQSSDEDHELNTSTLRVPPRSPVHHPSSPMPQNRPEVRRSPRIRSTETSAATQVPGPSNTSGAVGRDDETQELEGPRWSSHTSLKDRRIPIDSQEKQRAKATNNKKGSTQIRSLKTPAAPAVPGPSDAPDPVEIDDEIGFRGFEDVPVAPMDLQRDKIVQENKKKIIKPTTKNPENRTEHREVPVDHLRSSEDHAPAAPPPAAEKTVTLEVPVHHSIFSPIGGMASQMPHNRPEFPLKTPPAAGLLAPSTTHDSMEIDDEVEEQPQEAAEAEKNLPSVKSEPDSPNVRFENEEIIEVSSTSPDSSPDLHNSRSMFNVTLRRDKSTVPSVSDAVLLPHRTDNWTQVEIGSRYKCTTINDLKKSIAVYNNRAANGEFRGLNHALSKMFAPEMQLKFFEEFRPKVTSLALQLPTLMRKKSISMLKCNKSSSVTLSRGQIACILANAFFCTFPEDSAGASLNFSPLFEKFEDDAESEVNQIIGEKLKCIMEYFWSINKDAEDLVTFSRFELTSREQPWEMITNEAQNIEVKKDSQGLHENSVLIIFTNDSIGGGIFGFEAGTEEICFLTHPELLALRLLAEPLEYNEALFVSNVQQFCRSQGSAGSFKYASKIGRASRNIIIMKWKGFDWPRQFTFNMEGFMQEVNRMDSALGGIPLEILNGLEIIEGGLAGDDYPEIEFLLMIMIASKYQHKLIFFTHDDEVKQEILLFILGEQAKGKINAAKIYKALRKYNNKYGDAEKKPRFCFWLQLELLRNKK